MLFKKHNGTWRICVDFTSLNKACSKDNYPLPLIDWKVESFIDFEYKCFINAYKGYHQILMKRSNEEKTTFYNNQGLFCYTKMPFGLKNARATYQELIDREFIAQISVKLEACVDDMVIKSKTKKALLHDIIETLQNLQRINMKLNPSKCTFRVEEGQFLEHIIDATGLKENLKKIQAVLDMKQPKNLIEIHNINRKLAALNQFLS
ncbi:reverse transcriptase domain-containing protein [Tanacetum coccineum]